MNYLTNNHNGVCGKRKNIFYFFDGTGISLDSNVEKTYGKSVVGELFDLNKSRFAHLEAKPLCSKPGNQAVITHVDEDGYEKTSFGQFQNIKIYFPGPGAESCSYKKKLFAMPGRAKDHFISLKNYKSSSIQSLNLYSGNGWEHNESKALICAASLSNSKLDCHFIVGYSRGAITAISFSKKLSELRPSNAIYLFLIDPVAGGQYSKIDMIQKLKHLKNCFHHNEKIIPYFVGKNVEHAQVFYACTESRADFKPQLPVLRFGRFLDYDRQLFFPKGAAANLYFMYADHQQIAYRKYLNINCNHAAGHRTFNEILLFINSKVPGIYDSKLIQEDHKIYADPCKVAFYFSKENRNIFNAVNKQVGCRMESYLKGKLFELNQFEYDWK